MRCPVNLINTRSKSAFAKYSCINPEDWWSSFQDQKDCSFSRSLAKKFGSFPHSSSFSIYLFTSISLISAVNTFLFLGDDKISIILILTLFCTLLKKLWERLYSWIFKKPKPALALSWPNYTDDVLVFSERWVNDCNSRSNEKKRKKSRSTFLSEISFLYLLAIIKKALYSPLQIKCYLPKT